LDINLQSTLQPRYKHLCKYILSHLAKCIAIFLFFTTKIYRAISRPISTHMFIPWSRPF
jgi:hypothetical protein